MNKYEKLRAEYLLNCRNEYGESCAGDTSVGIFPCPYWQGADVDGKTGKPIPAGCLLKAERDSGGGFGLNDLAAEIHENAVAHGWWEEQRGLPEILMLCVSELAEALEEHRDGKPLIYGTCALRPDDCEHYEKCETRNPAECKPEGVAIELADCVIRILDYCGRAGIDIETAILAKHEYNKTRPYRHGGKKC